MDDDDDGGGFGIGLIVIFGVLLVLLLGDNVTDGDSYALFVSLITVLMGSRCCRLILSGSTRRVSSTASTVVDVGLLL